jgi:hypothetical protein
VALSDKWGLYMRPVVTMVNSLPQLDQNGHSERTNGFGDTVLGIAAARPLLGGRLVLGAGPRSRFPRRRSESSARTPGRSALMSVPRCSARTSSPTASCSNGSRSAETAGTQTR